MNTQMSQQEIENQIIELFSLLEETFKGKDNKKIKESMNKLNEIYKKNPSNINILFLALSYKSIAGRELTLNNHKSVALYLKNLLLSKKNENPDIIFSYLNKIFELIFEKSKENPYLNNYSIISSFQSIIQNLLSFKNMLDKKDYLEKLFNSILNYIQNENTEYFLAIAKSVILFCTSLLSSKCADDTNYNQLINSYYIPIIDIIFSNVPKYLNPKNNMYNIEFITIIKLLLDGFYNNLQKTKGIFQNDTIKDIEYIKETTGLEALNDKLKSVALLRKEYPEASLKDLGEMLTPPLGKSGVNHRLKSISEFADDLRKSKGINLQKT